MSATPKERFERVHQILKDGMGMKLRASNEIDFLQEIRAAERSAREQEAQEIIKMIDDRIEDRPCGPTTISMIQDWIRQRHAKQPDPLPKGASMEEMSDAAAIAKGLRPRTREEWRALLGHEPRAVVGEDTKGLPPDKMLPHWEARVREIAQEEILPIARQLTEVARLVEQLAEARLKHAELLRKMSSNP